MQNEIESFVIPIRSSAGVKMLPAESRRGLDPGLGTGEFTALHDGVTDPGAPREPATLGTPARSVGAAEPTPTGAGPGDRPPLQATNARYTTTPAAARRATGLVKAPP